MAQPNKEQCYNHLNKFESSEFHAALTSLQQLSQSASGHCTEGHGFNSYREEVAKKPKKNLWGI